MNWFSKTQIGVALIGFVLKEPETVVPGLKQKIQLKKRSLL